MIMMMSLKLTIKVVAFFLGHPVYFRDLRFTMNASSKVCHLGCNKIKNMLIGFYTSYSKISDCFWIGRFLWYTRYRELLWKYTYRCSDTAYDSWSTSVGDGHCTITIGIYKVIDCHAIHAPTRRCCKSTSCQTLPITKQVRQHWLKRRNAFQRHCLTLWRLHLKIVELWCLWGIGWCSDGPINSQEYKSFEMYMHSLSRYQSLNITTE